jgi:hypothetical protein
MCSVGPASPTPLPSDQQKPIRELSALQPRADRNGKVKEGYRCLQLAPAPSGVDMQIGYQPFPVIF